MVSRRPGVFVEHDIAAVALGFDDQRPVLEQDPHRPVVLIDRPRGRHQNSQTRGAQRGGIAPTRFHLRAACVGTWRWYGECRGRGRRAPPARRARPPSRRCDRVIVGRDDQIERVVVMRLQVGDDGPRAGAGIDQDALPLRCDDERRIALAHIEEAQLQRLRPDRTDDEQPAEGGGGPLQGASSFRTFERIASSWLSTRRFSNNRPRSHAMIDRGAHTSRTVTAVDSADGSSRKNVFQPFRSPRSTQPKVVGGVKSTTSNSVVRSPNRTLNRTPFLSGLSLWVPPHPGSHWAMRLGSVSRAKTRSIDAGRVWMTVRLTGRMTGLDGRW